MSDESDILGEGDILPRMGPAAGVSLNLVKASQEK